MNLKEKYGPWAVIAGASEGVGKAFAHRVAAEGINCILLSRRIEPLEQLAIELKAAHRIECVTASIDLSTVDAVDAIINAIGGREVGLFIANAGADSINSRFLDRPYCEWQDLIHRNVLMVAGCCHHLGGLMRERKRGGIILVGSGACYGGSSFMAVYSGTKAFDLCFGEGLWTELRPYGVDVLNLILGQTDTPAFRETLAKMGQPVPENLAAPEDVARVGLQRLPHGPVHNWGLEDDAAGYAPSSAAARRSRIEAIDRATKAIFGDN
ncbi:SDR family NAD(P)-dependent oxidoreductase [Halioxenophilus sp. WMMB6]|uniref:SDR family NAD(P)-dependent oxidoreductase n=1 Tax=Halioxenophilus sp. WMMB6 TaxID=3073815 RepID=UPI00295E310D|nr:SDR family NAD(P)-dependent oxidoreductase [Halioxenophilus sp. WMMB6]